MSSLDQVPACVSNVSSVGRGVGGPARQFVDLANYGARVRYPGRLKPECVATAMTRGIPNRGFLCSNPSDSSPVEIASGRGSDGPCMTQEIVDHVTWVVNQGLTCVGALGEPINPEIILRKMNNETGFHFFRANRGGVGLGQLTSSATNQVLFDRTPFYQRFLNSRDPACEPFKRPVSEAAARLGEGRPRPGVVRPERPPLALSSRGPQSQRQPQAPRAPIPRAGTDANRSASGRLREENWCSVLSSTNGLAANTMIAMMYFVHTRSNQVVPQLRPIFQNSRVNIVDQQKMIDLATLAAYGDQGNRAVGTLVAPLRSAIEMNPNDSGAAWENFRNQASRKITYLERIESTDRQLLEQGRVFNGMTGRRFPLNRLSDCTEPAVLERR